MSNQRKKGKDLWFWLCTILGIIVAILTPFINEIINKIAPSFSNKVSHIEFIFWSLSIILIFAPWIPKLKRVLLITEGIIDSAESLTQKFNEVAIWRKQEVEKISIKISDLDDYLILLPLHLSVSYLKGMDVIIDTSCCGSDNKAIQELLSGKSNFAITDPHYLSDYPDSDLVLLAPIITKAPMWWMSRDGDVPVKKPLKIFSYEKSNNRKKKYTYTSRALDSQISKKGLKESNYSIYTIKEVVDDLCNRLSGIINDHDETLINKLGGLEGLKKEKKNIASFECLLFSCVENHDINQEIKAKTIEYFKEFDFFLVTEPDSSFIKRILSYKEEKVLLDDDAIFTGVITTRTYLREFPVASLKFLMGIRDGILKSNIALMNKDSSMIKQAFQDALNYQNSHSMVVSKAQKTQLFQEAFGSINDFLLDESFFPDDLILLDTSNKYTSKKYHPTIEKYKNNLIRTNKIGGNPLDTDDPNVKFIIKGLGYDC